METVKETLSVGGHRPLAAQESERILEDVVTDMSEHATPPSDEPQG